MEIKVGDKIRFSTELLQEIHDLPNHRSVMVRVEKVEADEIDPECKIVWVKNDAT